MDYKREFIPNTILVKLEPLELKNKTILAKNISAMNH